jgi:predicted PurR-regulated permease PerM
VKKVSLSELIVWILIFFVIFIVFYYARKTFVSLVLSAAFSYILSPMVKFFEVRGIKRSYTVGILYLSFGVLFLGIVFFIIKIASFDIESFINNWPSYYSQFENIITSFVTKTEKIFPIISQLKIKEKILGFLITLPVFLIEYIPYLVFLFIVPFISFFILLKGNKMLDMIVSNVNSRYVELIFYIVSRIDKTLGNYLRGILTEAFVIFIIAFFGLFLMKIEYFSILAFLSGISPVVPYLGAFVAGVLSAIFAYIQYSDVYVVFKVLLFFIGIRFFDDWFLQPYIMKKNVNINPAVVVLSLMAGGEIAGFWGVVFAVPVVCILREIIVILIEVRKKDSKNNEFEIISVPYT